MTASYTLAHFSDLHLTPVAGFSPRFWNAKRALGFMNYHRVRRAVHRQDIADRLIDDANLLRLDHIAITGDLANLGLPSEHAAALAWLQRAGPPEGVTVVPGNHDIYSVLRDDPGVARWAGYMGGEEDTLAFPFVRRVGPLALIGLNSAIETEPFVAAGRLGREQIEVLGDLLPRLRAEGAVRVILIHHPPLVGLASPRRALRDAAHLTRALEHHGAELVLYGHNHRPHVSWLDTVDGALPVVGSGSSSASRAHGHEPLAQYGVFTFFKNTSGLRIRHTLRGLETRDGPVVRLSEKVLDIAATHAADADMTS